jgi:alpha-1,4-digalacturonate transport system substrate-binding protein
MKKRNLFIVVTTLLLSVLAFGLVHAQDAVELRLTWYDDSASESGALRDALDQFEADNPDIKVVIDIIDYAEGIQKTLPLQIEAGEGPDIARMTAFTGKMTANYLDMTPYLKDADYWTTNFPEIILQAMRPEGDTTGVYGFPIQFTITGPYINRTLFEQAGVDVPSDSGDPVSWQDWTDAAKQVAEATDTPYAMAMDRSGHRFAGPAISMGATFFNEDGTVTIDSQGFRDMANILIGWHTDDITPAEVWKGNSGTYAPALDYFVNGQLVFYLVGNGVGFNSLYYGGL